MSKKLIIVGCGGHAKVVTDIAMKCGYQDIGFLDDFYLEDTFINFPVLGKVDDAKKYSSADFFIAIGNANVRKKIYLDFIEKEFNIINLIHPAAVIASDVEIGVGTVVMAGTVINPSAKIGKGCIINTSASVDHDCTVGDFSHISVGAHIAGTVNVGKNTWIGIGAVVSNNVDIADDCLVGAGAVVVKNLTDPGTYVGVPAKKIK